MQPLVSLEGHLSGFNSVAPGVGEVDGACADVRKLDAGRMSVGAAAELIFQDLRDDSHP